MIIKVYVVIQTVDGVEHIKGVFSSEYRAYRFVEKYGDFKDHCIKVYLLNSTTQDFLRVITF